jgi:SAM-dependent methyltransferase
MTRPDDDIVRHYEERYDEAARLTRDIGPVEEARTRAVLARHLPEPPARILDVGGGPGAYARWLAGLGYEVHLVDLVPGHVEQAEAAGGLASASVGNACDLPHADRRFDAVLLLGPLYHLPDRADRLGALAEAIRVAVPGAPVFAAAVSRFASALDGLHSGYVDDPRFRELMDDDLAGRGHRNPTGDPRYFTTAFFHHPEELAVEMAEAGLTGVEVLAVEGIAWAAPDIAQRWADPQQRAIVADLIARLEAEPTLLGASPHLLGVGFTTAAPGSGPSEEPSSHPRGA